MYTKEYQDWSNWSASRLNNKQSLNIVLDLQPQRSETMRATAIRLTRKINNAVFKNATRRFNKELVILIHGHTEPHKHLHCLIEIPERMNTPFLQMKFKSKIDRICIKDRLIKKINYMQLTDNAKASQFYNGKGSIETALVF